MSYMRDRKGPKSAKGAALGAGRHVLYYGDNLEVMRQHIDDDSVDLVYLDPPFQSDRDYNVLFHTDKVEAPAQIKAFEDTWEWDEIAAAAYSEVIKTNAPVAMALESFHRYLGGGKMMAYMSMMAIRLIELHRILKPTGSLYLHCDPTASHYLKIVLDAIFGPENFLNEISWKRTTAHNDPRRFGRISDRLLFYSKGRAKTFNRVGAAHSKEQLKRFKAVSPDGRRYKCENLTAPHYSPTRTVKWRGTHPGDNRQWRFDVEEMERLWAAGLIATRRDGKPRKDGLIEYLDEVAQPPLQDIWTDIDFPPTTAERLGYPTQKPVALLERIIASSSNEGDVVLDPFCGCGTAIEAAQKLGRRWIGIDITHLAIGLIRARLSEAFGDTARDLYRVVGEPTDLDGARQLALDDRFQFEQWALGLVGARTDNKAKGADKGIDGALIFQEPATGKTQRILFSVKSGKTSSRDVRDLRGVVEREKAAIGVLITLQEPTRDMKSEAADAGLFDSPAGRFSRLQVMTIEDLLTGKRVAAPVLTDRKPAKQVKKQRELQFTKAG